MLELSHIVLGNSYMYRKSLQEEQVRMDSEQFINRLGSLPMVNLAWTTAYHAYEKTKERNGMLRAALTLAESSVMTVASTTKPLVDKMHPQISAVNTYACEKLSNLETRYPVITKPTDQVYADSKKACEEYLKPVTSRVSAVSVYGTSKVTGVKDYSMAQVAWAQSFGQGMLEASLKTPYGKMAASGIDGILTTSEGLVDKYLPPEEGEVNKPESNPVYRMTSLTTKVRRRMYKRALRDLRGVRVKSQDALAKLNFTVNLIDYAKNNFENARTRVGDSVVAVQGKVTHTWTRIVSEEDELKGETTTEDLEERTIQLARHLARQIRHSAVIVSEYVAAQPQHLRDTMSRARKYAEDLYTTFSQAKTYEELPKWILEKSRDKLTYVQKALSFATDFLIAAPLDWLAIDLDMENIQLEETQILNVNGYAHFPEDGTEYQDVTEMDLFDVHQ